MTRVWIGDARVEQLKYWHDLAEKEKEEQESNQEEETNNTKDLAIEFITNDIGAIDWFNDVATTQLLYFSGANNEIIIMNGFFDCLHSCRLAALKGYNADNLTKDYAKQYCDTVETLVDKFSDVKFYFCSVLPVDDVFSDASSEKGFFSAEEINSQISLFNTYIQEHCKAAYIDTNEYVQETGLSTIDGFLLTKSTSDTVSNYVKSKLIGFSGTAVGNFVPRTTAPDLTTASEEAKYWISNQGNYGGFNRCLIISSSTGAVLPNCVGYAWGRFMEILGTAPALPNDNPTPNLSTSNAEDWYGNTSDGYERGQEPRLGAVICWRKGILGDDPNVTGSDAGHVAIVEKINPDGSIITSESGYLSTKPEYDPDNSSHFWTRTRENDGNWDQPSPYVFQGFIYCPSVTGELVNDYVSKADVTAENKFLTESEMQKNARYIWQYLGSRGWTLNAVAGMLGNMESESSISPNRYELIDGASLGRTPTRAEVEAYFEKYKSLNSYYKTYDSEGSRGRYPGCGLTGWTFSDSGSAEDRIHWDHNKLIKWCDDKKIDFRDIDSNLERIIWEKENEKQWITYGSNYKISFKDFSVSTKSARWLAEAFLDNYENPASPNFQLRGDRGEKWFNYLLQYSPGWGDIFEVINFKLDSVDTTTAQLSFLVNLGETGKYKLTDSDNNVIIEKELDVKPVVPETSEEESKEKPQLRNAKLMLINLKDLIPNSTYNLAIEIKGKNADEDKDIFEESITFTTEQDYPQTVSNLELNNSDKYMLDLPDSSYSLKIGQPAEWGYWRNSSVNPNNNNFGYIVQVIVNGVCIKTLEVPVFEQEQFIPDTCLYFSDYTLGLGDSIQFGITPFVTDLHGEKVYNELNTLMSKSVCFLNQPYKIFLTKT